MYSFNIMADYNPETPQASRLRFAAAMVEKAVPTYDIKQSDPVIAAEFGVGNCVAKSVIAAILLERAKLVGSKPALAWNQNTHPKKGTDLLDRPVLKNGHAFLLTTQVSANTNKVDAISFNPQSTAVDCWEIFDFNDEGVHATSEDGRIRVTEEGQEIGYVIEGWYDAAAMYMNALNQNDSIYIKKTEEQIRDEVISHTQVDGLVLPTN